MIGEGLYTCTRNSNAQEQNKQPLQKQQQEIFSEISDDTSDNAKWIKERIYSKQG